MYKHTKTITVHKIISIEKKREKACKQGLPSNGLRKDTDKSDRRSNKTCSVGGLTGESRVGVAERWCTRRCQPGRDVELEIELVDACADSLFLSYANTHRYTHNSVTTQSATLTLFRRKRRTKRGN